MPADMNGDTDVTLIERVKALRSTINEVAYAKAALRSDQGNEIMASQPIVPNDETRVDHSPIKGSPTTITQSGTDTVQTDKECTNSDNDESEELEVEEEDTNSDNDESEELEVEEEVGWRIEVLDLYSTNVSDEGVLVFTSTVPPEVRFKQELAGRGERTADRIRTFGIVHRHRVERGRTRAHSIEVQHQNLKEILSVVFQNYLNLDPSAPLFEFYPSFEPFVHCWDRLLAAEKAEKEGDGKKLLKALTALLSQELEDSFRVYQDFKNTGYIDFAHILFAYKPGDIIMRSKAGILSAGKLRKARKVKVFGGEELRLRLAVLDWDGESCGYREKTWRISSFAGIRRVSDLEFFPLHTHSESEQIKAHLVKRGEIFDSLCGRHMRTFQGLVKDSQGPRRDNTLYVSYAFDVSISLDTDPLKLSIQLSERVIVDAKAYHQFHRPTMPLMPLNGHGDTRLSALSTPEHQNPAVDDSEDLLVLPKPPLNESDKMLAVPKVKGFALENKSWHKFNIQGLRPISWDQKILGSLVLETEEKKLLVALVSQHGLSNDTFDDFVQGKGK